MKRRGFSVQEVQNRFTFLTFSLKAKFQPWIPSCLLCLSRGLPPALLFDQKLFNLHIYPHNLTLHLSTFTSTQRFKKMEMNGEWLTYRGTRKPGKTWYIEQLSKSPDHSCAACKKTRFPLLGYERTPKLFRCPCKRVNYCNRECQKLDWNIHKDHHFEKV